MLKGLHEYPPHCTHLIKGSDDAGHPDDSLARERIFSQPVSYRSKSGVRTRHPTSPLLLMTSVLSAAGLMCKFNFVSSGLSRSTVQSSLVRFSPVISDTHLTDGLR